MVDIARVRKNIFYSTGWSKYKYLQGTGYGFTSCCLELLLLLAYMPTLTPAQIIEAIVKTANKSTADAGMKDVR